MYHIKVYASQTGASPYLDWLNELPKSDRAKVSARISRFQSGNLGDHKRLSQNLFEARIFLGPGYRVYFGLIGKQLVILLTGGNKGTQKRDIAKAKVLLEDYLENEKNA